MRALSAPLNVDLNLVQRCNLTCGFCYAFDQRTDSATLTTSQVLDVLGALARMNVLKVNLSGGEPLLRRDIREILQRLPDFDLMYSLNTNGTLVDEPLAAATAAAGFCSVGVSIDGPDESTYALNRGQKSAWGRATAGIRRLLDHGVPVRGAITLTRHNVTRVMDTLHLAAGIGIEAVGIQFICPADEVASALVPSYEGWIACLLELTDHALARTLPCKISFNPPNEAEIPWEVARPLIERGRIEDLRVAWGIDVAGASPQEDVSCIAGRRTCTIAANGDVYACEMFLRRPDQRLGNVLEAPIAEIWAQAATRMPDWRRATLGAPCDQCDLPSCGGGCRAAALYLSGSLLGPDLRCPRAARAPRESA